MPDPNYKALCAELVAALDPKVVGKDGYGPIAALLPRARAALAQSDPISDLVSQCRPLEPEMAKYLTPQARWRLYGDEAQPEPVAPTDEEIMELMPQQMRDDLATAARALAGFDRANVKAAGAMRIILNRHAVDHARAVLSRYSHQ